MWCIIHTETTQPTTKSHLFYPSGKKRSSGFLWLPRRKPRPCTSGSLPAALYRILAALVSCVWSCGWWPWPSVCWCRDWYGVSGRCCWCSPHVWLMALCSNTQTPWQAATVWRRSLSCGRTHCKTRVVLGKLYCNGVEFVNKKCCLFEIYFYNILQNMSPLCCDSSNVYSILWHGDAFIKTLCLVKSSAETLWSDTRTKWRWESRSVFTQMVTLSVGDWTSLSRQEDTG